VIVEIERFRADAVEIIFQKTRYAIENLSLRKRWRIVYLFATDVFK
jgi:hypothetical protein